MTLFLILSGVNIVFYFLILFFSDYDTVDDYVFLFGLSVLTELLIIILCLLISNDNKTTSCIESTQPIKPKIIHVQDSSRKIIQYRHKEHDYETIIMKDDIKFFIPESLIYVQPCTGEISAKKVGG